MSEPTTPAYEPAYDPTHAMYEPIDWDLVRARRRRGDPDDPRHVRPELIAKGYELLLERGPGGMSIAECARRAKVASGAPYTWFADAADFREAVTTEAIRHLRAELDTWHHLRGPRSADAETAENRSVGPDDPAAALARTIRVVLSWHRHTGLDLASIVGLRAHTGKPTRGLGGGLGKPTKSTELAWERGELLATIALRVHAFVGCGCALPPQHCAVVAADVEALVAVCSGYAALVRGSDRTDDEVVAAVWRAVSASTGRPTDQRADAPRSVSSGRRPSRAARRIGSV